MQSESALSVIPDDELLRRLGELVSHSRRVEADLVAHIGEVDERKLYAREAAPSMFAYCTERLRLSEAEAYRRITVARAARKHEVLLAMLRDGRLHLSGIAMLAPLLTPDNRDTLLKRATHRSKRQIQELVAELSPRPDAPSLMRKLPPKRLTPLPGASQGQDQARSAALELVPGRVSTPAPASARALEPSVTPPTASGPCSPLALAPTPPPSRPAVVEPLSPARYKVQFTASAELHDKLERLSALMRSEVPDGDLAAIIERAVTEKLERLEARRYAQTSAPRKELGDSVTLPASRHIPAAVRRAVRERDGDRCRYVDEQGRRCSARDRLELHHRHPFGMGGDHSPDNLRLLCSVHNRYLAEHDYGSAAIRRHRRLEKEASA
jgi:5-methylcytosine-specific restriction endonuclease McrA